jgi:hypothetical protein
MRSEFEREVEAARWEFEQEVEAVRRELMAEHGRLGRARLRLLDPIAGDARIRH